MRLRNTNPMGAVDLPLIGQSLEAGQEFDVPDEFGPALLEQVGNYELVEPAAEKAASPAKTKES